MNDPTNSVTYPASVEQIIAVYLAAADAGQPRDPAELLARHPEFAAELATFIADHARLNDLAAPFRPACQSIADNATPSGEPPTLPWTPLIESTDNSAGARFGDYELLEEIGRGGMGVVFKARQTSLNRMVALKMILAGQWADQEEIRRFLDEAVNAAAAQHPNIIAIHEIGQIAGQIYFTMDYVDGPNLATLIRENLFPARHAARLMRTIAEAVHAAHGRGVLHRDLKPSNILLGKISKSQAASSKQTPSSNDQSSKQHAHNVTRETGTSDLGFVCDLDREHWDFIPKITDFGLAKRMEGGSDLTGTGQILGTPSYMSPEQAAAKHGEFGPASDVYSLGAVLYELMTGRPPHRAESPLDTLVQVLESEPVSPRLLNRNVPRDLETICLKCLQKQPRGRYSTAAELADDLARFLNDEPIRARPIGSFGHVWRWCKRRPGWAAFAAALFVSLAVLTAVSTFFTLELDAELARTVQKQQALQIALARQVAERLDSDLRQLAAVPRGLAALLAERSDWTEPQIDATLGELIDSDPRIFGMCVALEPNQFEPGRENYARYICRRPDQPLPVGPSFPKRGEGSEAHGVQFKYLHPPQYDYREWDWYRTPRETGQARWSEPYIDTGGGDIPMVTFSVPFTRSGQFAGVVTADLSLAYFRQLKTWLDELQLARGDYGFVVSPAGTFISDANPDYQMGRRITEFARPEFDTGYTALFELIQRKQSGSVRGIDFWTGIPVTFLVAPVPSSGWSFVAVVPEP